MKLEGEIERALFNALVISNPENAPNEILKARAEERINTLKWVLDKQ